MVGSKYVGRPRVGDNPKSGRTGRLVRVPYWLGASRAAPSATLMEL